MERKRFIRCKEILAAIFLLSKKFERIKVSIIDSITGKIIHAEYFVAPDYLSIGIDDDWARINITAWRHKKLQTALIVFYQQEKWLMIFIKQPK
jgi:hypothetical protein